MLKVRRHKLGTALGNVAQSVVRGGDAAACGRQRARGEEEGPDHHGRAVQVHSINTRLESAYGVSA
jgi:hypothetical protein